MRNSSGVIGSEAVLYRFRGANCSAKETTRSGKVGGSNVNASFPLWRRWRGGRGPRGSSRPSTSTRFFRGAGVLDYRNLTPSEFSWDDI